MIKLRLKKWCKNDDVNCKDFIWLSAFIRDWLIRASRALDLAACTCVILDSRVFVCVSNYIYICVYVRT